MRYVNQMRKGNVNHVAKVRDQISSMGAPTEIFSFNDIGNVDFSKYKLFIFPQMHLLTPERRELLEKHILKDGKTVLTTYAPSIIDGKKLDVDKLPCLGHSPKHIGEGLLAIVEYAHPVVERQQRLVVVEHQSGHTLVGKGQVLLLGQTTQLLAAERVDSLGIEQLFASEGALLVVILAEDYKQHHSAHRKHRNDHHPRQRLHRLAPLGNDDNHHSHNKNGVAKRQYRPQIGKRKEAAKCTHSGFIKVVTTNLAQILFSRKEYIPLCRK
jgi:hypothetical protein